MTPERFDDLGTERANPRTADLDLLPTEELLLRLNAEDARVAAAVAATIPAVARAVDLAVAAVRAGGRVVYFGAGTSGRVAAADAAEVPPTFGVDPSVFQARVAGGREALFDAAEGAEDSAELGARDAAEAGLSSRDVAVALSASGRTPYCLGALREARRRGAKTVAVVCSRGGPLAAETDVTIDPDTGEEAVSGSTRLKAGTAQKLVLNMLSTAVMTRLGRVHGNLMVGVVPTNEKLRARAARLVRQIVGRDAGAEDALAASGGDVRVACLMLARGMDADAARRRLAACDGSLRRALA